MIWFLEDNPRLSAKAKSLIEDLDHDIILHTASWFEISIKLKIGKLTLPDSLEWVIQKSLENQIRTIDISLHQMQTYLDLPLYEDHRDPFDRLIIATAICENATIISSDPKFGLYRELAGIIW